MIQKGRREAGPLPVMFLTHVARKPHMLAAVESIGKDDVVGEPPVIFRIEDETLA